MSMLPFPQLRLRSLQGAFVDGGYGQFISPVKFSHHVRTKLFHDAVQVLLLFFRCEEFRLLHFRASRSPAFRTRTVTSSSSSRSAAMGALASRCATASASSSTSAICSSSRLARHH